MTMLDTQWQNRGSTYRKNAFQGSCYGPLCNRDCNLNNDMCTDTPLQAQMAKYTLPQSDAKTNQLENISVNHYQKDMHPSVNATAHQHILHYVTHSPSLTSGSWLIPYNYLS